LSKETEVAIYRIIQAALHNVASHAQAHRAQVGFDFGADSLQVTIEDDGLGFDPEAALHTPGEHLGLIGMRERAESLSADLAVNSTPGRGTRIGLNLSAPVYLIETSRVEE
jgi:two-component system sensor histidine kinase DegS